MEAKVSPLVTGGQGSPASTPQDMTYSNNLPHTATLVPNQLGTSAPATNLPVSQPHPSVTSGMTAGVQPAAVSRVVQPAMTLANIMPASGQPHRTGPVAPGQLHRPGPVAPGQLHRPGPGASGQPQRPAGPGLAGRARTGAVAPQLAVRPQQATYLTPGSAIPHGMHLMRTEMGQMVMVPHNVLAQMQAKHHQGQTVPTIHPRPATPTPRQFPAIRMGAPILPMPGMTLGKNPISVTAQANQKLSDPGGGTFRDDDINDVASMAGVNLNEENARILATSSELVGTKIRSCKDENFLATGLLQRRILHIARRFGVSEVPVEVVNFISHATQCRLSALLEKVSAAARHRTDGCGGMDAEGGLHEQSSDVRAQLRFFKQLESMEKQRKDEQEREILLKAARSRARQEDPEQACLKQKAKEIQQQELALIQQHDANRTALDAIGPRKKRKLDAPPEASATDSEVASGARGPCSSAAIAASQKPRKQVTRVNLWDFVFCVEQERPRSLLLYKALLR